MSKKAKAAPVPAGDAYVGLDLETHELINPGPVVAPGPAVAPFKVELWDIGAIKPYPKNTKKHPDDEIARLARTIGRFGWDQPIVVDGQGVIIKGHGRRLAALRLGLDKVPVLQRHDLSPAEADAARIADNAVIGMSFDTRLMQEELHRLFADLVEPDFTPEDLGLSAKDQKLLLEVLDEANEDALIEDTHAEIERQKAEDEEAVAQIDEEKVSIAEAFGFKHVSREQARAISRAVALGESELNKKGSEALVALLELAMETL